MTKPFITSLLLIFLLPAIGISQISIKPGKGKKMVFLGTTKGLKDIAPIDELLLPPNPPKNKTQKIYPLPEDFVGDPVIQDYMPVSENIVIGQNFEGVPAIASSNPDTEGDVGPNHYFQMNKSSFSVWDKEGNQVYGPAHNSTLWSEFIGPWNNMSWTDPIVIYDHLSDRWLISGMVYELGVEYYEMIAVSTTGDPLGEYNCYSVWFDVMPDYPKFGLWPDGYYLSINEWIITPGMPAMFDGASILVFNRQDLQNASPEPGILYFHFDAPNHSTTEDIGSFQPSHLNGPPPPEGTPNYPVIMRDDAWGWPQDMLWVWECHADWQDTSNSYLSEAAVLPTAPFVTNLEGFIHQPSTPDRLDCLAFFFMYRLQYRNFGDYWTMVCNHSVCVDSTEQAAVRWYELRNWGSGWDIYQQGTYAPDDESRWMGSIAMDADGNIGMGYSVSSDQVFPSVRITGRNYNDPILGIMTWEETTVVNGGGSQTMNPRWGDYSTMSVDQTDDLSFWYTGEYIPSSGYMNWSTRINSFQLHKKLSLSSDSIVFMTEDDCINGKSVILKNNSWYDIEFEDIQPDGVFPGAAWYIDSYNFTFPFTLAVGDSLELLVKVDITKDALSSGFLLDSMSIETAYKEYNLPVMLNEGLFTSIHENEKEEILKVYPNPFSSQLIIEFKVEKPDRINLQIYDQNMKLVSKIANKKFKTGKHTIEWNSDRNTPSGIYYVILKAGNAIITKKVIRAFSL